MTFEQVINNAYQEMAKRKFTVKQKCQHCFGSGSVADYSIRPYGGTSSAPRRPCEKCGGSGEVMPW